MGAKDSDLSGIVFLQASTVAFLGSVLGIGLVISIRNTWNVPLAPIDIPWQLMAASIGSGFRDLFPRRDVAAPPGSQGGPR